MSDWTPPDGWFVYACSDNDGLETMVQATDIDGIKDFEDRECESLEYIIWWE